LCLFTLSCTVVVPDGQSWQHFVTHNPKLHPSLPAHAAPPSPYCILHPPPSLHVQMLLATPYQPPSQHTVPLQTIPRTHSMTPPHTPPHTHTPPPTHLTQGYANSVCCCQGVLHHSPLADSAGNTLPPPLFPHTAPLQTVPRSHWVHPPSSPTHTSTPLTQLAQCNANSIICCCCCCQGFMHHPPLHRQVLQATPWLLLSPRRFATQKNMRTVSNGGCCASMYPPPLSQQKQPPPKQKPTSLQGMPTAPAAARGFCTTHRSTNPGYTLQLKVDPPPHSPTTHTARFMGPPPSPTHTNTHLAQWDANSICYRCWCQRVLQPQRSTGKSCRLHPACCRRHGKASYHTEKCAHYPMIDA
jgi:hypothetical protein